MAKKKLSADQRDELRKALSQGLKAGRKRGELVKETAEKYGITTVTATWYLKNLNGHARPAARGKSAKRGRPRKAPAEKNGLLPRLVKAVESRAAQAVRKVKEARRLVPKWRALLKKELHLKALESKLRRELSAVSKRAKSLGGRIRELVEV